MNPELPAVVAATGLWLLSIEDIRSRELSEKHVAAIAAAVAAASALAAPWRISPLPLRAYLVVNAILLLAVSLTALLGMLGWGDVAALAIMFIATPTVPNSSSVLPTLLVVLVYYIGLMLLYIAFNLVTNLARLRELPPASTRAKKLLYMMIARPIEAKRLADNPGWWYPLSLCGKEKLSFNIYMNPPDVARTVQKAIRKGCVKPGEKVWATYGIPAIPLLAASYTLALVAGDKLITTLLGIHIAKALARNIPQQR